MFYKGFSFLSYSKIALAILGINVKTDQRKNLRDLLMKHKFWNSELNRKLNQDLTFLCF